MVCLNDKEGNDLRKSGIYPIKKRLFIFNFVVGLGNLLKKEKVKVKTPG